MPVGDDDNPDSRKAIRRAPIEGDVVPARPTTARSPREIDDDPSEEDIARLDNPVRKCPSCRKDVYDDAEVCHHCGHAFSADAGGLSMLQIGVVGLMVLGLLALVLAQMF